MKNLFLGLALTLSFSAFADSKVEDTAYLQDCGGKVELRSYIGNQGEERFALQFIGVQRCSNVRLSTGKNYKLTDGQGNFEASKNFSLSNDAAAQAKSYQGLGLIIESNSGSTIDEVIVKLQAPAPAPAPAPSYEYEGDYESSEWN